MMSRVNEEYTKKIKICSQPCRFIFFYKSLPAKPGLPRRACDDVMKSISYGNFILDAILDATQTPSTRAPADVT